MKIGFIGLGKMGVGMARNLMRAGHELTVYNRTKEKAASLVPEGASVAATPAEGARDAEAVFTMLADDTALTEVVFGTNGIAASLAKDAIHLSSSTISTVLARKLASEHGSRGQQFVSAPVFGRPEAAEGKNLVVLLAGNENVRQRCVPLADAIGRRTFVVGSEPWQANAVKLCGNFMIASMLEAFSEAFAVIRKCEIEEQLFLDTMVEVFGSPVYANYGKNIVTRNFDPAGFSLKLGLKDVNLAIDLSGEVMAPLPFASIIRDNSVSALAYGQEHLDWSSLALAAGRRSGQQL
jgi:3-hydroxyisobutyrate dehydrogenase-like beta-hydroxyacid dehydrogenase